uniref:Uncharacterized protein n=1 Tax=Arundo donax TaxID=35708 RepID=A0A0A9B9D2_ARUDO
MFQQILQLQHFFCPTSYTVCPSNSLALDPHRDNSIVSPLRSLSFTILLLWNFPYDLTIVTSDRAVICPMTSRNLSVMLRCSLSCENGVKL